MVSLTSTRGPDTSRERGQSDPVSTLPPLDIAALPLTAIILDYRAREEFGAIDALAEDIREHGLLHPIVVDAQNHLVAGERRLRAVKSLGWEVVPVRRLGVLTAQARLEIELSENLHRKDLTPYEHSKVIVQLGELARAAATKERELREDSPRNAAGRPSEPGSLRDQQRRTGIGEWQLREAARHVEMVKHYRELAPLSRAAAMRAADDLDALPTAERTGYRVQLLGGAHSPLFLARLHADAEAARAEPPPTPPPPAADESPVAPAQTPGTPTPAPLADRLDAFALREAYLSVESRARGLLRLRPRAVVRTLSAADLVERRGFFKRLRSWLEEFEGLLGPGERHAGAADGRRVPDAAAAAIGTPLEESR